MKIATVEEVRNIDRRAVREFGIPAAALMENAAAGVLHEMEKWLGGLEGLRIGIVCGKGNNGGDGLALARRLYIRGIPVRVALLAPFSALSGEAKMNLDILRRTGVEIIPNASSAAVSGIISWSDVIVDAIFGVGLSSLLSGRFLDVVDMINSSRRPVVSIDIPTGINADTGEVMAGAVSADLTVTMCLPKRGLVLYPGALYAGKVCVADIGIPPEAIEKEGIMTELIDMDWASGEIYYRPPDTHKGDYGHLLVVAGSMGKAGAAVMTAKAALRAGSGLVSVAVPNNLVPVIHSQLQEAMCIAVSESIDGTIGIGAADALLKAGSKMTACAIGPGLTTHPEVVQTIRDLIPRLTMPMVLDADGLNALAGRLDILKQLKAPAVLTPHPGEMSRLASASTEDVQQDRLGFASAFATRYGVTLVLKGAATVIAAPDGMTYINTTGNPGMATAGTGDVLTGMIAGLIAQGRPATKAACLAVFLHGLAGDLAAEDKTEQAMTAGDVIENIPKAMKLLDGHN